MAVFMINICKFNECGITFPNLGDLIQHIEDTHIDYDPQVVEQKEKQQPTCLPLSYVLRFFTEASRKENITLDVRKKVTQQPLPLTRSITPTGSEFDDDEIVSDTEDSNDSWTRNEEFSSDYILRHGSRVSGVISSGHNLDKPDKPFACPIPGCKKRYKNINGIKYHSKNGHKKDGKIKKGYKCHCGKSYKTSQGLKNHISMQHPSLNIASLLLNSVNSSNPTSPNVAMKTPTNTLQELLISNNKIENTSLRITESNNNKITIKRFPLSFTKTSSDLDLITPEMSPILDSNENIALNCDLSSSTVARSLDFDLTEA